MFVGKSSSCSQRQSRSPRSFSTSQRCSRRWTDIWWSEKESVN
jgi:hypothetical protein